MSNCVLLVGAMGSGKTKIAEALMDKGFIKNDSYTSIETARRKFGNHKVSGEYEAWAELFERVEEPATNDNAIFEFSGTGKNVPSMGKAIEISKREGHKWLVVYTQPFLKDKTKGRAELLKRAMGQNYDAPMPWDLSNSEGAMKRSIEFMTDDLNKSYGQAYAWGQSTKMILDTGVNTPEQCADKIIEYFGGVS